MSNYNIVPSPTLELSANDQIRAYVNPTRMTILASLAREKNSVSGIARKLKVHPANITHHFKLLEKVGLIKLVEKRETGKNLEKFYRSVAYHFTINARGETTNKKVLALAILRDNLISAVQTINDPSDDRDVMGLLKTVRLRPKDIVKFEKKLLALFNEFERSSSETGITYNLLAGLYPIDVGDLPPQRINIRVDE
jgi:DNA-binding transcriptional ArsR family regulator